MTSATLDRDHVLPRPFTRLGGHAPDGYVSPNWYASVMGTGIVANAAAPLPPSVLDRLPGLLTAARGVWILDSVWLMVLLALTASHWVRHTEQARGHLHNPVMSHFYGAPAMGLMTVGAGALLVGVPVVGLSAAVAIDLVLWTAGTLLGLWTAVVVPYQAMTRHEVKADSAFGGWLMPVVPPMVSAATGPLLLPHVPAGQPRLALQLACTMMFGLTIVISLVLITLLYSRLVHHKVGAAAAVPTLWIVLGPLGQSITAAHNLGQSAPGILPAPYGTAFRAMGLLYGVPMWGFAMLWLAIAGAITVRTVRSGMPFSLTWWSFTFPVGTVVTGTSGLAVATGADFLVVAAALLYVGLVGAWVTVAVRTARRTWSGALLRAPEAA
ncbi:C4-dicarboxylate ABC transporter [Marmoricola endophyticus]|uniref:C4-dicarboxylate ABC transporter n=1 Tax=Marmoricola endophyticus TaxID=2040280 RepID=A0A917BSU2_9ACTN|nr:TDT family transporter [Marmoricola endophyticus]GGF56132.1 C4-dicarboxylate ABC transporter [Marmoricola endophyticus]